MAADASDALRLARDLQRFGWLHHVTNDHEFSEGYFFYRFYLAELSWPREWTEVTGSISGLTYLGFVDGALKARKSSFASGRSSSTSSMSSAASAASSAARSIRPSVLLSLDSVDKLELRPDFSVVGPPDAAGPPVADRPQSLYAEMSQTAASETEPFYSVMGRSASTKAPITARAEGVYTDVDLPPPLSEKAAPPINRRSKHSQDATKPQASAPAVVARNTSTYADISAPKTEAEALAALPWLISARHFPVSIPYQHYPLTSPSPNGTASMAFYRGTMPCSGWSGSSPKTDSTSSARVRSWPCVCV